MEQTNWGKYVKNTARVRTLSSPSVDSGMHAYDYQTVLTNNFVEIRHLAAENREILASSLMPYLESDELLSEEAIEELKRLQGELIDAYNIENLDSTLVAQIAERLYTDALLKDDAKYIIEQLDALVSSYYTLATMQKRIPKYTDIYETSIIRGFAAGEKLLSYLDKEEFAQLPDEESKELVLINSRYISALYEYLYDAESNRKELELLKNSIALEDDEFYREQAPNYNWDYHRMRALEYTCIMLELGNKKNLTPDECKIVLAASEELYSIWKSKPELREFVSEEEILLSTYRARYYAGLMSKEEYQQQLLGLYSRRSPEEYTTSAIMQNVLTPLEYILTLDSDSTSEQAMHQLNQIYKAVNNYVFSIPNSGSLSYLLDYYVEIMRNFIEIPGQLTFMDACLDGMAALHPPTYVHTIMVGRIAKCLCKNLIRLKPEAFIGVLGFDSVEAVLEGRADLENFIYNGSLCHDIGKIPIMDVIFTYGRNLTDGEFTIVKTHPDSVYRGLKLYYSTRQYADIALGHHRWYDNSAGYPNFDTSTSPVKVMIDLVSCADSMDAATDSVGRSYNEAKTSEQIFGELIAESGTRYTPYIVELLQDERTKADLIYLLEQGRSEVYSNTFLRLVKVQKSAQ